MNDDLIIKIFVPTSDGNGEYGTAYPVYTNRILTASHVLHPEGRTETSGPIIVQWYRKTGAAGEWREIKHETAGKDAIVWDGRDKGLDAALLACPFPEGVSDYGIVGEAKPLPHDKWSTTGFPRVGERGDNLTAVPMTGIVSGSGDTADSFVISLTDKPNVRDGWRGASGGPVFVNGNILGIVSECPKNWDQQCLTATPTWRLLEDKVFRQEIGYTPEYWGYRTSLYKLVCNQLKACPAAGDFIGQSFECEAGAIFDSLIGSDLPSLLEKLHTAYQAACDQGETNAATVIRTLALDVVPRAVPPSVVQQVRARDNDVGVAIIDPRIGTKTALEVAMAAAYYRKIECGDLEKPFGDLNSKFCLPLPPQGGFQDRVRFEKDFENHIINHIQPTIDPALERNKKIQNVIDRLQTMKKVRHVWYCVINMPGGCHETEPVKASIFNLNETFKGLIPFILLSKKPSVQDKREREAYDYLCLIIYGDRWSG